MLGVSNSAPFFFFSRTPSADKALKPLHRASVKRADHTTTKHDYPFRLILPMASFSSDRISTEAKLSCKASFIASSQ